MAKDYDALALSLLGEFRDRPPERALRIAGIYAAIYLEDPFLFRWFGLAAFVARQVNAVLLGTARTMPEFYTMLAEGNLKIYRTITAGALAYRDGVVISGDLESGYRKLGEGDRLARTDPAAADVLVQQALLELSEVEQAVIVQPLYDGLSLELRHFMAQVYVFRLGYDTAQPVLKFPGTDPGDLAQRRRWMTSEILPAFRRWQTESPEWLRSDCERLRRHVGVRAELLPPRA
jgi:hypothetical protein